MISEEADFHNHTWWYNNSHLKRLFHRSLSLPSAAYTYFYKGSRYWKFDNHRMKSEPGYPKSILRDFMGCSVDPVEPDRDTDADRRYPDVHQPPFNPDGGRGGDGDDGGKDGGTKDGGGGGGVDDDDDDDDDDDKREGREEDTNEVDVVLKVNDSEERTMNILMITIPLFLVLCILGLIYAIISTLQRKGAPRLLVHCKRSLQDWV